MNDPTLPDAPPPTPADGLPPETLPGPGEWPVLDGYEVLGVLGAGGVGLVFRARQAGLKSSTLANYRALGGPPVLRGLCQPLKLSLASCTLAGTGTLTSETISCSSAA